jgi:hypothetical protein
MQLKKFKGISVKISDLRSKPSIIYGVLIVLAVLGVLIRYGVAFLGHNYDMESWKIVANLINEGKNVYAHTWRYPYAPIWCYVLAMLDVIGAHLPHPYLDFRHLVSLFLSFVDVGIFVILVRNKRFLASAIFILSPISILITGYHSQFDNLAIFVALLGASILKYNEGGDGVMATKHVVLFSLFLALSITIKHVFIFFPIWMAFKSKKWTHRILFLCIPYALFLASFIPFWADASGNIIQWVFLYRSFHNGVFYELFVPKIVQILISRQTFFYLALIAMAFVYRRQKVFDSVIYYCAVILIFSSAIANQYLAIPVVFTALHPNPFNILYNIVGGLFLLVHKFGLHMETLQGLPVFRHLVAYGYEILITLLLLGWLTSITPIRQKVSALRNLIRRPKVVS